MAAPVNVVDAIVGYLDLSDGTYSAAFAKSVNELMRSLVPVRSAVGNLYEQVTAKINLRCQERGVPLTDRVNFLLETALLKVPDALLLHHVDQLGSLPPNELWQPLLIARLLQETAAATNRNGKSEEIASRVVEKICDYVGFRPIATVEAKARRSVYAKERVPVLPVYWKGVGVGAGIWEPLLSQALATLESVSPELLDDAHFTVEQLAEIAIDPRMDDLNNPVYKRPAYQFGEWDPEQIDSKGQYRRFVIRRGVMTALTNWIENGKSSEDKRFREYEASAALAGSMLLAAGVCGRGPHAYSSEVTLGNLVPIVARVRDQFYSQLLQKQTGELSKHLTEDAKQSRQPFGRVRLFLNQRFTERRAFQLETDQIAQLYARLGLYDYSRRAIANIPTPAIRFRTQITIFLTQAMEKLRHPTQETIQDGFSLLRESHSLIQRAIECGAFVDPWNILGFQGSLSVYPSPDGTVHDIRVDELLTLVDNLFTGLVEAAAAAAKLSLTDLEKEIDRYLAELASEWDQYATYEVADILRVCGRDTLESSRFVRDALRRWLTWRADNPSANPLLYWRERAPELQTAQSFCSTIKALLDTDELVAAQALLVYFSSQYPDIPLTVTSLVAEVSSDEKPVENFFSLALNWANDVARRGNLEALGMLLRFIDQLEVNGAELLIPPNALDETIREESPTLSSDEADEEPTDRFGTAYEGVTYRDSTDDGNDSSMLGGSTNRRENELATDAEIEDAFLRLRMLHTLVQIRELALGLIDSLAQWRTEQERVTAWLSDTEQKLGLLRVWSDRLVKQEANGPLRGVDTLMEIERGHYHRDEVINRMIDVQLAWHRVGVFLQAELPATPRAAAEADWHPLFRELQQSLRQGERERVTKLLPGLLRRLHEVPTLYVPLSAGGHPESIFAARAVRETLKYLAQALPRLGLFQATYQLLDLTMQLERGSSTSPHQVTEFNLLFAVGYLETLESVIESCQSSGSKTIDVKRIATLVDRYNSKFSKLWKSHINVVRLSEIERRTDRSWEITQHFIKTYGRDLFTQEFLSMANLRGLLRHGVDHYLDRMADDLERDPLLRKKHPMLKELQRDRRSKAGRTHVAEEIEFIARVVIENYDIYREFNSTTTLSDYGENLHLLIDCLRSKVQYDRQRWAFQPTYWAHSLLTRVGQHAAAALIAKAFRDETQKIAEEHLAQLAAVEAKHGLKLMLVRDRISERFIRSMELDRVLTLMRSLPRGEDGEVEPRAAEEFVREIDGLRSSVAGTGLEVPSWLRMLMRESQRHKPVDLSDWRDEEEDVVHAYTTPLQIKRVKLDVGLLEDQLSKLEKSLEG